MGRLEGITHGELHRQLERTDGSVPTQRVLAAIGRKQGDTIRTLAERHGVCEKTVRNWLDRFEERPIEQAPYDEPRPGGPSRLTDDQRARLLDEFNSAPDEVGYDAETWTSSLASRHVEEEYGIQYTKRHVRYLMAEAEEA